MRSLRFSAPMHLARDAQVTRSLLRCANGQSSFELEEFSSHNSQAEKARRRLSSNRSHVTKSTRRLRRPFVLPTMTADVSSAAAGDTADPKALATIPEDFKHADTANAKEMDANDEETTENSSNHAKSHILVTTANSNSNSNSNAMGMKRVSPLHSQRIKVFHRQFS